MRGPPGIGVMRRPRRRRPEKASEPWPMADRRWGAAPQTRCETQGVMRWMRRGARHSVRGTRKTLCCCAERAGRAKRRVMPTFGCAATFRGRATPPRSPLSSSFPPFRVNALSTATSTRPNPGQRFTPPFCFSHLLLVRGLPLGCLETLPTHWAVF